MTHMISNHVRGYKRRPRYSPPPSSNIIRSYELIVSLYSNATIDYAKGLQFPTGKCQPTIWVSDVFSVSVSFKDPNSIFS